LDIYGPLNVSAIASAALNKQVGGIMSSISAETWAAPHRNAPLTSTFGLVAFLTLAAVSAALAVAASNCDNNNNLIDTSVPQFVTTAGR
jgi:hypothetical protein